ncbi:hypothetical protein KIK02_07945 [Leptodesmis sichuanensis A121]|nr:hypothetical protein KIK02_07945 [Leptodesmis sichuanensis A121]
MAQAKQAEQEADWIGVKRLLEKAAALYQGDLLPSCYDDWIESERSQLQPISSCSELVEHRFLRADRPGDLLPGDRCL